MYLRLTRNIFNIISYLSRKRMHQRLPEATKKKNGCKNLKRFFVIHFLPVISRANVGSDVLVCW
jgi:hypothetical protein